MIIRPRYNDKQSDCLLSDEIEIAFFKMENEKARAINVDFWDCDPVAKDSEGVKFE